MYNALIMAGGSGTRLWPLSRESRPKQSLKLLGGRSMFQHAVERLDPLFPIERIWVVTRAEHARLLHEQSPELLESNFIIEPEGRGTAPAIALASLHLQRQDAEASMAVLTADHYILDTDRFQNALALAEQVARKGYLVTLGIQPTSPATGYGYIEQGKLLEQAGDFNVYQVARFVEKPDRENAIRMAESGGYSWNSGMFIWQVKRVLQEIERQMPDLYAQLMEIAAVMGTANYPATLQRIWPEVNKQTIDYGVMEGAQNVAVIPVEMGWSDIGSWSSLIGLLPLDEQGNSVSGSHLGIQTRDSLIFGEKRLIATIGVQDLVIVETQDALLICAKEHEQQVKALVEKLRASGREDLL